MAEETLEQRLAKLYAKRDFVDKFNENDVKTLVDAIRDAREHGGTASVDITPLSGGGGYTITITDSEGTEHTATVKDGGDAYSVYESTVPDGQTPMSKAEWLTSLKGDTGNDGSDGHNPCLGRFSAAPSPMPAAQVGDYLYVDTTTTDPTTQEVTTTTTVYHYGSNGWDSGTVINADHPKFASGQDVTSIHIKDLDGNNDPNAAGVLSAEAGAALAGEVSQLDAEVGDLPAEFLVRGIGFVENVLIQSSGQESSNNSFNATTFIPVNKMEKLYFFNTVRQNDVAAYMAFYDESQTSAISTRALTNETLNTVVSVDVPKGASFARITIRKDSLQNFRAYTVPIDLDTFINGDLHVETGERVNLISEWIPGVIASGGGAVPMDGSFVSNYVPVEENVKYFGSIFQSRYAYYDKNLKFIRGYSQDGNITPVVGFTIPTGLGIKYARFSYYGTDTTDAWLNNYSYFPPIPHKEYYNSKTGKSFVKPGTIDTADLSFLVHDTDTDMIKSYAKGGYIRNDGNVNKTSQSWSYTDFIELEEGGRYYIIGNYPGYTAFYDENRNFVSNNVSAGWFVVPVGVKYIRASWNSLDKICFLSKFSGELPPFAYRPVYKEERPTDYMGEDISVFHKIICIGDSLTAGVFNVGEGSPSAQQQWAKYNYPTCLSKITGVETLAAGIGSITTPGWYEYYQNEDLSGFDCAIIQLGVNDGGWSDDVKDGYDNIIAKLRNDNKDIIIFISNIIHAVSYGNSETARTYNENIASYVANRNEPNTILLDMSRYGHVIEGLAYNAGHLTGYGYWRLAADYKAYIGWYMHNNRDDFRFVHFIGTNCYY